MKTAPTRKPSAATSAPNVSHFSCWRSTAGRAAEAQHDRDGAEADARDQQGEADPAQHREEVAARVRVVDRVAVHRPRREGEPEREHDDLQQREALGPAPARARGSTPSGKRSGSSHSSTVVNGTQAKLAIHAARSSCGREPTSGCGTSAEYESVSTITPALSTRPANMAPIGLSGRRAVDRRREQRERSDHRHEHEIGDHVRRRVAAGDRDQVDHEPDRDQHDADDDGGVEQALPRHDASLPQPERHVRRLHRVAHDVLQVGAQQVELDLLAQPRAERLQRALRVVAAPVEAPVDEPLDAAAQRQEQRGHDERRAGDRQVRAAGERREHRLPREHEPGVRRAEQHRQQAVDERARDQQVDVEQPVAQDPDRRPRAGTRHHPDVPERARRCAVAERARRRRR